MMDDAHPIDARSAIPLADWRRRVFEVYAAVRANPDPIEAWSAWRAVRDDLFRSHPSSPLPPEARRAFSGLDLFAYDPSARTLGDIEPSPTERVEIGGSAASSITFLRIGRVRFELFGEACTLAIYWLDAYGGGLFLPFADATSGVTTYGGGRYLLDTAKGADLGADGGRLVIDLNFAYNPSCSYDPGWACPLPGPENRLPIEVRAGERTAVSP
jgi:uncharacterized protein (DUF1684 family)